MSNSRRARFTFTAILALAAGSTFVFAHQFAMVDTANPITISGVVTAFEWTNPHVYIVVPSFNGESIGRWDGDTLVINTKYFVGHHH